MAGIAGCANAGKTERGIRKTMSDSKTINENGKENPEQLRELIESLNNEITRLKSRNEELEKQCRGWLELQTKQIEENNRLNAENGRLRDFSKSYDVTENSVYQEAKKEISRLTASLARAHEVLEYVSGFFPDALELLEEILEDAKRCYVPEKGWPPHIESAINMLRDDSDQKDTLKDVEEVLSDPSGSVAFERWKKMEAVVSAAMNVLAECEKEADANETYASVMLKVLDMRDALESLDAKGEKNV